MRVMYVLLAFIIAFGEGGCDILLKPPIPDPGAWYPNGACPSVTYIKALRLKYAYKKGLSTGSKRTSIEMDPVGYSDESGLKFLEIFCANTGTFDLSVSVKSIYSVDDQYSYLTCPGNTYASAYQLFFTNEKDVHGNALTNSWYMGPHQFANNSASSLRLFCGKKYDTGLLGPQEAYGPIPQSFLPCGRSWTNASDYGILCKFATNRNDWHNSEAEGNQMYGFFHNAERQMTWEGSFKERCCWTRNFVCSGSSTSYKTVKECDNTKGRVPIGCSFDRRVGVSYEEEPMHYDQSPENAVSLHARDIQEQQKMGLTLDNVGSNIIKNFGYREGVNTSSLPATVSEERSHGSVVYSVSPGLKSRVRQLYGECGVYRINTDVFEVMDWDTNGREVMSSKDAYPLKPRLLSS